MASKFKGFKQVTADFFNRVASKDKAGYLWFVRSNISGDTYSGDLYLGNNHYGHMGPEFEELSSQLFDTEGTPGILTISGNDAPDE